MTQPAASTHQPIYHNPVFGRNFPDPFVLKFCGEYWAYCTGTWQDGRLFGILRSRDLVNWQEVGGAMEPLPGNHPCYWAPEVTVDNGRFYLYYSVGNETTMHIRVAVADHPGGPFLDSGRRLTNEPFAIDAHVFSDDNGRHYLFYATDFLDLERVGTGTVMDHLLDPLTLSGRPRPVSRARYDWQIYDPQRVEKGGVRWHTLEGPFVLKRKGIYYQMFSGGNWQNPSYGVSYATTRNLDTQDEWQQACDGEQVPPILRTVPDQVIGPGHNSVVRGPDNRQLYCIYHRWGNGNGRQLALDPLDFAGERLLILGPSHTPQPQPLSATFTDFFDGDQLNERWQVSGQWQVNDGAVLSDTAVLTYSIQALPFLAEVSVRALAKQSGSYGLTLTDGGATLCQFRLIPEQGLAVLVWPNDSEQLLPLPPDFRFEAYQLLRLEVNGRHLSLAINDHTIDWQGHLAHIPTHIALFANQIPAAFASFALTIGWQDCFENEGAPTNLDWISERPGDWVIQQGQLAFTNLNGESLLQKGPYLLAYELVVNARLDSGSSYGITPVLSPGGQGPLLTIERVGDSWAARWQDDKTAHFFPLPSHFDPTCFQQFRFRKENGRLTIHWEQDEVAVVPITKKPTCIGLYGRCATAAFDMVRVTALAEAA